MGSPRRVTATTKEAKKKGSRTKGSGGLFERTINGKKVWVAQVELGRDPLTGMRRRKTLYGENKTELQKKITGILNGVQSGTYAEPNRMTLAEYLETWLQKHCYTRLKAKTIQSYEDAIRRHLVPSIGHLHLSKLAPLHLESHYAALRDAGVGTREIQYAHDVLRSALNRAVKWKLLTHAVTDDVERPEHQEREQRALDEDEIKRFLEVARGHRNHALFMMAVTTGMRPGELLGLKWDRVDLDKGIAFVEEALVWLDGQKTPFYATPKSSAGIRSISLPDVMVRELRRHRIAQNEECLASGPRYSHQNLVFCTRDGKPLRQSNFRKTVKALFKRANLPDADDLEPYTLRRTHATYLISNGEDIKTVQDRMGHSTAKMLLDIYAKVVTKKKREPAKKFDELLGPDSPSEEAATSKP
ncbi:MAG TPA: site-specific integrase [Symbiobacteriaceae bacterium]|nr:site-specific integrase [Symbiobacteriaceae bacterium]